jgi:hypothetical protein
MTERRAIRNYELRGNQGWWVPPSDYLSLGFEQTHCGADGPAAWEMAEDLNRRLDEAIGFGTKEGDREALKYLDLIAEIYGQNTERGYPVHTRRGKGRKPDTGDSRDTVAVERMLALSAKTGETRPETLARKVLETDPSAWGQSSVLRSNVKRLAKRYRERDGRRNDSN